MNYYVNETKLQEYTTKLLTKVAPKSAIGSPLKAATVSAMTDQTKIYVYTGSESSYTAGNWYYWDGTAWTSGGVYNSVAVVTDDTLTQEGEAADAKKTGDEIAAIKSDLYYEAINITAFKFSDTNSASKVVEKGSTVDSVTLAYTINKTPTTLKLDSTSLTPATSGSQALTSLGLTANKTWTLEAKDSGSASQAASTSTKTATLSFQQYKYWGAATSGTLNSAFVKALANKEFSNSKAKTFTVDAGSSNKYIWYALSSSITGAGSCTFKVGGFDGGFEAPETVSVTNDSGYTENYYVYRSTNAGLGSTTVTVS